MHSEAEASCGDTPRFHDICWNGRFAEKFSPTHYRGWKKNSGSDGQKMACVKLELALKDLRRPLLHVVMLLHKVVY